VQKTNADQRIALGWQHFNTDEMISSRFRRRDSATRWLRVIGAGLTARVCGALIVMFLCPSGGTPPEGELRSLGNRDDLSAGSGSALAWCVPLQIAKPYCNVGFFVRQKSHYGSCTILASCAADLQFRYLSNVPAAPERASYRPAV
jgi:hypothetical protein